MEKIITFLESKGFLDFYEKLWSVLLPLAFIAAMVTIWKTIGLLIKSHRLKKQIERICHSAGMEDFRFLRKPLLKKFGIKVDDKHYEKIDEWRNGNV